jgi:hypothetical protein
MFVAKNKYQGTIFFTKDKKKEKEKDFFNHSDWSVNKTDYIYKMRFLRNKGDLFDVMSNGLTIRDLM